MQKCFFVVIEMSIVLFLNLQVKYFLGFLNFFFVIQTLALNF